MVLPKMQLSAYLCISLCVQKHNFGYILAATCTQYCIFGYILVAICTHYCIFGYILFRTNDINILCIHRLRVVQEQFKQTLVDVVVLPTNLNFVEQTSSYNHIQILRASLALHSHVMTNKLNFRIWMEKQVVQQLMFICSAKQRLQHCLVIRHHLRNGLNHGSCLNRSLLNTLQYE